MKEYIITTFLFLVCLTLSAQRKDYADYDFHKADSTASSLKGVKVHSISKLSNSLTANLDTDVEKIRAIYKWIAENIEYDVVEYHKYVKVRDKYSAKRRTKYLKKNAKNVSKKTLRKGMAICYGYSYLFQEMTAAVGIQSHLVGGYSKSTGVIGRKARPEHAWNIVYLDQQWYPIDVTWSSGYTNKKVTNFTFDFNDLYFLTKPEVFIMDHYPRDPMWTMMLEPMTLRDFFNAPIVHEGFVENKINRFLPESGIIRSSVDSTNRFFFTSNKERELHVVSFQLISLKDFKHLKDMPATRVNLKKSDLGYYCDFKFPKAGRYRLQVFINSSVTLSYDAYVKNGATSISNSGEVPLVQKE